MKKIFFIIIATVGLNTISARADVQLAYKYSSITPATQPGQMPTLNCPCKLIGASIVTEGEDAEKLFKALSDSYPSMVTQSGKMGLQPEIDLPNISCGLQATSHSPSGLPSASPTYQCYTSITLP